MMLEVREVLPPGESVCRPPVELDVDIPSAIVLPLRHRRCLLLPSTMMGMVIYR
jgi:hypothetical protein